MIPEKSQKNTSEIIFLSRVLSRLTHDVGGQIHSCVMHSSTSLHLTTRITSPINYLLYFKIGKSNQYEIFTIAKSFNETNNHVKYYVHVVFRAFVRI